MRQHLLTLDERFAFQTSARFDLLAHDHVPHAALGARDIEATIARAIDKGEGVVAITGRMGSGKSSAIAAVTSNLDEGFVPLRVTVVGVDAGNPLVFARHAIQEISDLPEASLARHERLALERATAQQRTRKRRRELRAGFSVTAGAVLTANVVGDIKTVAGEELVHATDPAAVLSGLQRLYDAFWKVGRCPVLIVDDTDHWGGSPDVADAFFHQTARALGRQDAVILVAVHTDYTKLNGYKVVRDRFTAEVDLPALPNVHAGLAHILQRRIDAAGIKANVDGVFDSEALRLIAASYTESVVEQRAGDMRRTLAVARNALELAVEDPRAAHVSAGHVQESMARNPLAPGSALDTRDDLRIVSTRRR